MSSTQQDPPTLSEKYSGIPDRLLHRARRAKAEVFKNLTKDPVTPRKRQAAIPKGISKEAFGNALNQLSKVLGEENVEVNDQALVDGWYMEHPNTHDAFHLFDVEDTVASAIVYPGTTAEVQKIVLWANEHVIPLFPISMGRNLGYGGAAPRVRGSVVIDLGKRMNKVLDINPEDCTCLLEPGVSFYALHEAIQAKGYKHLWVDVPDLGGGSVVGNTLDRGVGYTPYGDHWAMHAGLEVVLPTGETFPYGFGPFHDGIFSQSNFGIVTKMGMTLMPSPGGSESYMYTFRNESDLFQLIEIIRPLRVANILENVAQLKHCVQEVAALGKPKSAFYKGDGPVPMEVIRDVAKRLPSGNSTWIYYGTSYGPAHIRKYKLDIIHEEFMKVSGAKRIDPSIISTEHYFWSRHNVASGLPQLQELDWLNWLPNGAHVFFSPISPTRGQDAKKLLDIAKKRHAEFGIDLFPAFCIGLREMHLIINMVYDRANEASRKAAYACMSAMIEDAANQGYGEYRTHLLLQDQVAATYSWNNSALASLNNKLKDALDPAGILAPGRCGIWPARYRGRDWELTRGSEKPSSEGHSVGASASKSQL